MTETLDKWRRLDPATAPQPGATPADVAARVRECALNEGMTVVTQERYSVWAAMVVLGAPPHIAGVIRGTGNTEAEALAAAWAEHLRIESRRDGYV